MEQQQFTTLDRLRSMTRVEIYRMVPIQAGLLIPMVLVIAGLSHWVDGYLELPPVLFAPLSYVLCALLMGLSAAVVYWSYTYLALEGAGSPNPSVRQTTSLVTSGPYAVVRHPTVTGKLVGIIGLGLLFRSATFLFFVVPALAVAAVISNRVDQELPLEKSWGEAYRRYRQRVPMIIPGPRQALSLAIRARRYLLSAALVIATVSLMSPTGIDLAWLGAALPRLLAACGLLSLCYPLQALILGPALTGLSAARRLGLSCGQATVTGLMGLGREQFELAARQLLGPQTGSALAALLGRRTVALWACDAAMTLSAYVVLYPLCGAQAPLQVVAGIFLGVTLLARLPLFYNYLGAQELGLLLLLGLVGVPAHQALLLSLLVHLARLPAQLLGGLVFLVQLSRWEDAASPNFSPTSSRGG